jgi:hypothetical protein
MNTLSKWVEKIAFQTISCGQFHEKIDFQKFVNGD